MVVVNLDFSEGPCLLEEEPADMLSDFCGQSRELRAMLGELGFATSVPRGARE